MQLLDDSVHYFTLIYNLEYCKFY